MGTFSFPAPPPASADRRAVHPGLLYVPPGDLDRADRFADGVRRLPGGRAAAVVQQADYTYRAAQVTYDAALKSLVLQTQQAYYTLLGRPEYAPGAPGDRPAGHRKPRVGAGPSAGAACHQPRRPADTGRADAGPARPAYGAEHHRHRSKEALPPGGMADRQAVHRCRLPPPRTCRNRHSTTP